MISNVNSFFNMEQFFNTSWLLANLTAFYVALRSKFVVLQIQFLEVNVEKLQNIALILGIISSIIFLGYNISKWYQQILVTREYKKKHGIRRLFKRNKDNLKLK